MPFPPPTIQVFKIWLKVPPTARTRGFLLTPGRPFPPHLHAGLSTPLAQIDLYNENHKTLLKKIKDNEQM